MPTLKVWAPCTKLSSARTAKGALSAVLWPTGMVMVWPLVSEMVSGAPTTGALTVAV